MGTTAPFNAGDGFAITPHDTNTLSQIPDALDCTSSGTATVITAGGTTLPIYLNAGVPYPLYGVTVVKATGTTATGIIGLLRR